jgi:hypothetical protein
MRTEMLSETDEWYYSVNISSAVNTTGHMYTSAPQTEKPSG